MVRNSIALLVAAGLGSTVPQAAFAEIVREDFKVQGATGVALAVREVRDTSLDDEDAVLLIHGARVSGIPSFDLDVSGGSLAAELARAGHRVFIMDARGYGGSDRPGQDGPREGEPLGRSADIVEDIHTVVSAVGGRTADDDISLLGWATGGTGRACMPRRIPTELTSSSSTIRSTEHIEDTKRWGQEATTPIRTIRKNSMSRSLAGIA